MRWLRFAVVILFVTVLQAGLINTVAVTTHGIKPDLLIILLVFFAIYCGPGDAIVTSFAIGLAADLIGPTMGPQIISFGIFGSALAYLHRYIAIRKMPYQAAAIFAVSVLAGIVAHFLAALKGAPPVPRIYGILLGTSLYSGIVGPFLFLPSAWLMRINTSRFSRQQ